MYLQHKDITGLFSQESNGKGNLLLKYMISTKNVYLLL